MRRLVALLSTIGVLVLVATPAHASVSPSTATISVAAGGSARQAVTVNVPSQPTRADIEIAIDTTGSMSDAIEQAKNEAINLVTQVRAGVPDAAFAVVQFKDDFDSPEYEVAQPMTATAADVQTAIEGFSAAGGGDIPEAYNLVFHNSAAPITGGDIGWRPNSRKFVVVIGDAPPHGAGTNGSSDCPSNGVDPHALNTATELTAMKAAQRTLFMIGTTDSIMDCYTQLAAGDGFTGSAAVLLGSSFADQIVELISAASSTVGDVHLEVVQPNEHASWLTFSPKQGPVSTPAALPFNIDVAVPPGTAPGSYSFDIVALADGGDIGHHTLTVVVPAPTTTTTKPSTSTTSTPSTTATSTAPTTTTAVAVLGEQFSPPGETAVLATTGGGLERGFSSAVTVLIAGVVLSAYRRRRNR